MSAHDIAKDFTDALKAGDFAAAEGFWSEDIVSIENADGPMRETRGRDAVHDKGEWWTANHKIHAFTFDGPFVNGDQFAVFMRLDVTRLESGERVAMDEVGLYTVRHGKIVEERFMY